MEPLLHGEEALSYRILVEALKVDVTYPLKNDVGCLRLLWMMVKWLLPPHSLTWLKKPLIPFEVEL